MKHKIILLKYFFRRNWPSWLLFALLYFQFVFNHETVTRAQDADLQRRRNADVDSLYNCATAKDLRQLWQDSRNMLLPASQSMVSMNNLSVTKGNTKANAYDNKIAKNDSLIEAKSDKYLAWLKLETGKIDRKYLALQNGRSGIFLGDRAGFALMIPIVGAAAIGLVITMNRLRQENPSPLLPVFGVYAGVTALVAQFADFFMLKKRALDLLQDSDYAIFSALAYSCGVLSVTIIAYFTDKKKLHAELLAEIEQVFALAQASMPVKAEPALEAVSSEGKVFGIIRRKNPLESLDLSGFNKIDDLPLDRKACCEIYAAYEMQHGGCPSWLSMGSLEEYLTRNGIKGASKATLHGIINSYRVRKAA